MSLGDILRASLRRCLNCGGFDRPDEGGQPLPVCSDFCYSRMLQRLAMARGEENLQRDLEEIRRRFG